MNNIQILDCTLRDGGYCNEWAFGLENTKRIISGLVDSNVEIIECGFLSNKDKYDSEVTKFNSVEEIAEVIPKNRQGKYFVAMMNYGEFDVEDLPECDNASINGIRVAFHKKDMEQALGACESVKNKGYLVFVQAMVSLNYSDEEFLDLIRRTNKLSPKAFYIVDSFGTMKSKDLIRLFYVVEHNLNENISIGFHSHNNMQLAYSNAQSLVSLPTNRNLIIDSSIFGMGRGAGNLNTELFLEFLNENVGAHYNVKPLLVIIDEILSYFYSKKFWGYSLPNYISATHGAHPNYALFFDDKKTLTYEAMNELFEMMEPERAIVYDREYAERLYLAYMERGTSQKNRMAEFKDTIANREVMIIAPGKSSFEEKDKILKVINDRKPLVISVNCDYKWAVTDYIFVSNMRRFGEIPVEKHNRCITTSNIASMDSFLTVDYKELINTTEAVEDNSSLMLIKLLILFQVSKLYVAGIDGYSIDPSQNFADQKMNFYTQKARFEAMNDGLNIMINRFAKDVDIEYITNPRFVRIF